MFSWTALPVRVDVQPETKMIIRSRKGDFFIKSIKIGLYK
jgi:hypothetical protein